MAYLQGDIFGFVAREFGRVSLGDPRRERRLAHIVRDFAENPSRSIPEASGRWAATKATYRFLANPRVSREKVMTGHWEQTADRIRQKGSVLVVEDTTILNFSHHPSTEGLGVIGSKKWANQLKGALVHSALAVEVGTHRTLGLIDQQVILRQEYHPLEETPEERRKRPRESGKWMSSAQEAIRRVGRPQTLIFVFDREGDIFDVFEALQESQSRYVIRASANRRIALPGPGNRYLLDQIRTERSLGETVVAIPARGGRAAREARLTLRSGTYPIAPPRKRGRGKPEMIRVVYASEENAPTGVEAVEWILLTTEPVQTVEQVLAVVGHYTGRWKIEEWHKVLKTGCRIEERELEAWDRLDTLLGILSVVAWRLLALRDAARAPEGEIPLEVLSESERTVLRKMDPSLTAKAGVPEYLRTVAKLGGFLARKRDGEPGWITLWRGFTRLHDLDLGFRMATSRGSG